MLVKDDGNFVFYRGAWHKQGRIEVRKNGIWGTICETGSLNDNVAITGCKQLG